MMVRDAVSEKDLGVFVGSFTASLEVRVCVCVCARARARAHLSCPAHVRTLRVHTSAILEGLWPGAGAQARAWHTHAAPFQPFQWSGREAAPAVCTTPRTPRSCNGRVCGEADSRKRKLPKRGDHCLGLDLATYVFFFTTQSSETRLLILTPGATPQH